MSSLSSLMSWRCRCTYSHVRRKRDKPLFIISPLSEYPPDELVTHIVLLGDRNLCLSCDIADVKNLSLLGIGKKDRRLPLRHCRFP